MNDREDHGRLSDGESGTDPGSGNRPDVTDTEPGTGGDAVTADPADGRSSGRDQSDRPAADRDRSGPTAVDGDTSVAEVLADERLGEPRRLDGTVRVQWVVGRAFGAVFGAAFLTVVFHLAGPVFGVGTRGALPFGLSRLTLSVGLTALAVLLVLAALRSVLLYRSWRYEVREDSLYLTRGVLTQVQTVAPYVRVQHIDTRRSPVERLLGLSSLVVYTAGSRGADVTIPGLTDDRAAELQSRLKRLAIASEEEDAV